MGWRVRTAGPLRKPERGRYRDQPFGGPQSGGAVARLTQTAAGDDFTRMESHDCLMSTCAARRARLAGS